MTELEKKIKILEKRIENAKKLLLKTELRPGSMFVAILETLTGERDNDESH